MHNLDLEAHLINIKCPKCDRIITEPINKLRNNLVVSYFTFRKDFEITKEEFKKKLEKIEDNIRILKNSLKKP